MRRGVVCIAVVVGLSLCASPGTAQPVSAPSTAPAMPTLRFGGTFQGWLQSGGVDDPYRVRRMELSVSGAVTPNVDVRVMVDAAKSIDNLPIVQDAYVTLKPHRQIDIRVGRFRAPLSYEGTHRIVELELTERAMFMSETARQGKLANIRDVGAMVVARSGSLQAMVGVFNGDALYAKGTRHAVIGRIECGVPGVTGLTVSASGAHDTGGESTMAPATRAGADVQWVFSDWTVRSEVMRGEDDHTTRLGYTAVVERRFGPWWRVAGRYDVWDPDTDHETTAADGREHAVTGGVRWLAHTDRLQVQLNVLRRWFPDLALSSNQARCALQVAW